MADSTAPRELSPLPSRVVLSLCPWILYGVFFTQAFLTGAESSERILFGCVAAAVSVCLFEASLTPVFLLKFCMTDPIVAAAAALAVYGGVVLAHTTPVISCAIVGALVGLLGRSGDGSWDVHAAPAYCGAFAGMTSSLVLVNPAWIAVAGLAAGVLYAVSGDVLRGVGGKLGSLAFGGVILTVFLAKATASMGPGAKLAEMDSAAKLAVLLTSLCAVPVTYWFSHHRGLGPVLGSAVPSAVVALALPWFGHSLAFGAPHMATAWFGASFVGMTSPYRILMRHWMLPVMGLMFGALWIGFKPPLAGFGGDLGSTAAVSVLAVMGVVRFFELSVPTVRSFVTGLGQ